MDKLVAETAWRRALEARIQELDALITTLRAENQRLRDAMFQAVNFREGVEGEHLIAEWMDE